MKELLEHYYNGTFISVDVQDCQKCWEEKIGLSLLDGSHVCMDCLDGARHLEIGDDLAIDDLMIHKIARFEDIRDLIGDISGFDIPPHHYHKCKRCSESSEFIIKFKSEDIADDIGYEYGLCMECFEWMMGQQ
jgi:hypothetical protein